MTPEQARKLQQAAAVAAAVLRNDAPAVDALAGTATASAFELLTTTAITIGNGIPGTHDPAAWPPQLDGVPNPLDRAVLALAHLEMISAVPALQWAQTLALGAAREA